MTEIKGKIVYHSGDKVELNGNIEHFAGTDWYIGQWIEGHRKGKECCMSIETYNSIYNN